MVKCAYCIIELCIPLQLMQFLNMPCDLELDKIQNKTAKTERGKKKWIRVEAFLFYLRKKRYYSVWSLSVEL